MKSDGDPQVDGDQLSFIAVNDPEFHKLFMTLCPTYTFIDRSNGKFNDNMTFKREYAALISAAWEIDKVYDWVYSFLENGGKKGVEYFYIFSKTLTSLGLKKTR